ncbi:glycosyltransferase family 2 protein [Ichthyenterobacterium magnum]|uniref:GT2 family glycosyltransferase n=1 Tax=Ichthyenterobacterium magnum TaxID=1230530 RepID=A0A420DUX0_9FLAO|nr:glycosyltransferase [Ichthyenterobacterium magnum]RKE97973.1 GT2 family glycosyltransferase [Ichthyenterobacterium magnum]
MTFTLIVCTYMRPKALLNLLNSVKDQELYPNEILIIDGSTNGETKTMLAAYAFKNLRYFKVDQPNRGLTKQRNYGILKVNDATDVICFLDDDIILTPSYFKVLLETYNLKPKALAVCGYINNEVVWETSDRLKRSNKFYYDGWMRDEPLKFRLRRYLGLLPETQPGVMSSFSNGRSISFLPPDGKIYAIDLIMGGISSYRKSVFSTLNFSTYFEGYGLYEDADFSLRLSKLGPLYVNTNAQLSHHHEASGRPNQFKYGKMVIKNGWYVWRIKYKNPNFTARLKWNLVQLLQTLIRFTNVINSNKKAEALADGFGRVVGWWSLCINKPQINR